MQKPVQAEQTQSALFIPKLILGFMIVMLAAMPLVCLLDGDAWQQPSSEVQRIQLRTALYIIAIITLPITNLLRHIQLRLNQTMPLTSATPYLEAKKRYLVTVLVSMSLIETIGVFGLIMYSLGDNVNSLFIFTGMSLLGLFLYRPKAEEFQGVVAALLAKQEE